MMIRNFTIALLLLLGCSLAYAASWNGQIASADGEQTARSSDGNSTLTCSMRNGAATSCRVTQGKQSTLLATPMTPRAGGNPWENCKCGYVCWEDKSQQMSVCICRNCEGSKGIDFFLTI